MAEPEQAAGLLHRLVHSPRAQPLLVWLSFLEASIIPIPLEAVLIPYMLARRDIIWRIAGLALLGFLLAAIVGYLLGALAFYTVGIWFIDLMGWQAPFGEVKQLFIRYGFWALFLIGLLPIPTQVAMLAGGAFGFSWPLFMVAMAVSRGIRYFGLALLVLLLGPGARRLVTQLDAQPPGRRRLLQTGLVGLGLAVVLVVLWLNA